MTRKALLEVLNDPVALTGADGRPARLAPGNTWVELVPRRTGSVAVR